MTPPAAVVMFSGGLASWMTARRAVAIHGADNVVLLFADVKGDATSLPAIVRNYLPFTAVAPLTEPPYLDRDDLLAACKAAGIEVPRLYRAGFSHNNCGGFCVRAGQAQFELLLREHPERYAFHEAKEQELREHLGKDVAILSESVRREPIPLTLTRFRERLEDQPDLFDPLDVGGCGCFTDPDPQEPTA